MTVLWLWKVVAQNCTHTNYCFPAYKRVPARMHNIKSNTSLHANRIYIRLVKNLLKFNAKWLKRDRALVYLACIQNVEKAWYLQYRRYIYMQVVGFWAQQAASTHIYILRAQPGFCVLFVRGNSRKAATRYFALSMNYRSGCSLHCSPPSSLSLRYPSAWLSSFSLSLSLRCMYITLTGGRLLYTTRRRG